MKKRTGTPVKVLPLTHSLKPLKAYFNSNKGKPRFMAVISPGCRYCIEGADAIKSTIIKKFPNADMKMNIVWINGVNGDNFEKAEKGAKTLDDPRFKHFHDPKRLVGKALANIFGGKGKIAWDIYMFFEKNSQWLKQPPMPLFYMHQLTPEYIKWVDPDHYHHGKDLIREFNKTMKKITSK